MRKRKKKETQFSTKSTKPAPSLVLDYFGFAFFVLCFIFCLSLLFGCVALPVAPRTSLCVFTNTYLKDSPEVKAQPKLEGKVMPPEKHFFRCRNSSSTKYNIPVTSESADKMIATPYADYLEMNAYYKKLADVFTKELNARTGGK